MGNETETAIERAVRIAGGVSALAKGLDESVQTVSNWKARGEPPANRCAAIESITGVPRIELRRDWRDYWPELVAADGAPDVPEEETRNAA